MQTQKQPLKAGPEGRDGKGSQGNGKAEEWSSEGLVSDKKKEMVSLKQSKTATESSEVKVENQFATFMNEKNQVDGKKWSSEKKQSDTCVNETFKFSLTSA